MASDPASQSGLTLADYAAFLQLPLPFLQACGLSDVPSYEGRPAVRIPYLGPHGEELAVRFRVGLEGADALRWRSGSKPAVYGLRHLAEARDEGAVALVESEDDALVLRYHGFQALAFPGFTFWREDRDAPLLDDIGMIHVVLRPGQARPAGVPEWLSRSRIRHRATLITPPK